MKFRAVAATFQQLEAESKRLEVTKILAKLFHDLEAEEAASVAYLALGDVQPVYLGTQFNFAEKSMLHVVAQLIGQEQDEVKKHAKQVGDIGQLLAQCYENDIALDQSLSVTDVVSRLLSFLSLEGTGSQKGKESFLVDFLRELDPISGKYIVRAILGKLRLGFSDMTLLDAFSWMVTGDKSLRSVLEQAYNVSADIGTLIKTLKVQGIDGVEKISIVPGVPILPAAAERLKDAKAIVEKLGTCVAQPKLDGFRLQVHLDLTQEEPLVRFFSRNLQDMSAMFPELRAALLDLPVKTLVAEGEAIAYDTETGAFLPFQETVKRRRKHSVDSAAEAFPLKLYLFDILYLNEQSHLRTSHDQRRKLAETLLQVKPVQDRGVVLLIDEKKINHAQQLEDYFNDTVSQGLEGLVVKRPDAIYQPGKRNFNWIKLKRQESGSLDDTLDCVILGYYAGRGKRAAFGIGALLVGVYDKQHDQFVTVAKIGTGLSDNEWREQKKACDVRAVIEQPHNVVCAKELVPDQWVNPELVCMIRADEITRSPVHTAGKTEAESGLALRFPRIMGYRPDKSAREATTVNELRHLFEIQFNKNK